MSKNVNVNGKSYTGVSQIQLVTTDGGTALFKDVDEITTPSGSVSITENGTHNVAAYASAIVNVAGGGGVESGTFVGDGTRYVTLSVTAKKQGVVIWMENATGELSGLTNNDILEYTAIVNAHFRGTVRCWGGNMGASNEFSETYVPAFNDTNIVIDAVTDKFASTKTYHWEAW